MSFIEDSWTNDEATGWDALHGSLIPLPAAFMLATLVSDALYWLTAVTFWPRASEWLLGAALATGAIAAAQALILYVSLGRLRPSKTIWLNVMANLSALLLSMSNLVFRLIEEAGRAATPAGIFLTAAALFLLLLPVRLGRDAAANVQWDDGEDGEIG